MNPMFLDRLFRGEQEMLGISRSTMTAAAMFVAMGLALLVYGAGVASAIWAGVWFRRS